MGSREERTEEKHLKRMKGTKTAEENDGREKRERERKRTREVANNNYKRLLKGAKKEISDRADYRQTGEKRQAGRGERRMKKQDTLTYAKETRKVELSTWSRTKKKKNLPCVCVCVLLNQHRLVFRMVI